MPSEKLRYLKKRMGPEPPLEFSELKKRLMLLDKEHVAEMLWNRAQTDDILRKVVMIGIVFHGSIAFEQAKAVIDYAFHFPEYIRYFEKGHDEILDEIKGVVARVVEEGRRELAIEIADYAINCAESLSENFEDDWGWRCSLESLMECLVELKAAEKIDI